MSVRYIRIPSSKLGRNEHKASSSAPDLQQLKHEFLHLIKHASERLQILSSLDFERMRSSAIPFNPLSQFLGLTPSEPHDLRPLIARRLQELLEAPGFLQVWNAIREDLGVADAETAKALFIRMLAMGLGFDGVLSPIGGFASNHSQCLKEEDVAKLLASDSPINVLESYVHAAPAFAGDLRPQMAKLFQKVIDTPHFEDKWKEVQLVVSTLNSYRFESTEES